MNINDDLSANDIKEKGNEAVRSQKYEEAILHYTYAIKLNANDFSLFSNRSLAFLKLQLYYFAMEDAATAIRLNPTWPKGYFRKAEVEFATFHYSEALQSYNKALELKPDDIQLIDSINRASQEHKKDTKADEQIPWVGAGVGIVLGVIIVLADFLYTNKPTLTNPFIMACVTISIAMIGYGIARAFRCYIKIQREGLLQAPLNFEINKPIITPECEEPLSNEKIDKAFTRYSKSQARQRYKKGKL